MKEIHIAYKKVGAVVALVATAAVATACSAGPRHRRLPDTVTIPLQSGELVPYDPSYCTKFAAAVALNESKVLHDGSNTYSVSNYGEVGGLANQTAIKHTAADFSTDYASSYDYTSVDKVFPDRTSVHMDIDPDRQPRGMIQASGWLCLAGARTTTQPH